MVVREDGFYRATSRLSAEEIVRTASHILEAQLKDKGNALCSPADTRRMLSMRVAQLEYEVFGMLWLTQRHHVIDVEELFRGTIDGANVYPREVIKSGLRRNAAAGLAFHNHPSGVSEPSQADRSLTRRLREAMALVDIRLIDHVVIGHGEITSFAERGWL